MSDLRRRLAELPCGQQLLRAAAGLEGTHLVGGAVRDLLLGRVPRELDVAIEGDLRALQERLGPATAAHERFGTATVVRNDGCRFDLAATRAESYAAPGALPDVRPAGIEEDLRRRDVTVHAIALDLSAGTMRSVDDALEDLASGRLRVLHDRSFLDDPTRLWRVARYAARLGFALEVRTARLAVEAVAAGAPATVSGARIGAELRLALSEPDPVAALEAVHALGLAPWLRPDRRRADAASALLPAGEGRVDLLLLASALDVEEADTDALLADLGLTASERAVLRAAARAPALARAAADATRPSELAAVLRDVPVEAVALAGADGAQGPARHWMDELRHVRLQIGGDDLLRAGIPEGPEVGRRLATTLARRLDGELQPGREAELEAARAQDD